MLPLPTISVILSTYNSQKTIAEAIESILQQTYNDFELILIDDGSTDNTLSILKQFSNRDNRIKIISNESNIGLTRSLNKGLQIANGEFIARMDADDISLPDRFEKQINFFNIHPDVLLLGGRYIIIDQNGKTVRESDPIFESDFLIRWRMLYFNAFIHSTVMFRSQCLNHVHGYNESIRYAQDYDLWVRMMQLGKAANLPDILIKQRRTDQMISVQHQTEQNQTAINIARDHINKIDNRITFSEEAFLKLQKYYYSGIPPMPDENEKSVINKWTRLYKTYISENSADKHDAQFLQNWFTDKLMRYPGNIIRIPAIIKLFPIKSILVLIQSIIRKLRLV